MKNKWKLPLCAAAILFSATTLAATDLYWCNGCDEAAAAKQHGTGYQRYIFIGNLQSGSLHKYFTYWVQDDPRTNPGDPNCEEGGGIRCGHFVTVDKTSSITAIEKNAFDSLRGFYYQAPVGWKKARKFQIVNPINPSMHVGMQLAKQGKNVSNGVIFDAESGNPYEVVTDYPNPNVTVFDVINQGPVQNDMLGWAGTHFSSATFAEIINDLSLFHVTDTAAVPNVEWTIRFSDQSMISINMDFKSSAHKWSILPNSAYDARNNSIPRNMDEIAAGPVGSREIFDYTRPGPGGDLERLLNQLRGMGVSITGRSGSGLACVRVSSGGVSCTRFTQAP